MYTPKDQKNVVEYAKFIATLEWHFFCTFTAPYSISFYSARRFMNKLKSYLEKQGTFVFIFWVAEPFDIKEGCHIHALIKIQCFDVTFIISYIKNIKAAWRRLSRGNNKSMLNTQIEAYIEDEGADYYIAKYIHKPNAEYDFL